MQATGSSSNNAFRCFVLENNHNIESNFNFTDTYNNETDRWFVYWIRDSQIFGVTDGMTKVYEKVMDRQMRRDFLGHVAEGRLDDDWSEAFDSEAFEVRSVLEESVDASYINQRENLPRVKTGVAARISKLLYLAISSSSKNRKPVDLNMSTNASPSKKLKAMPKSENRSLIDPSKRKRTRPPGLQFDD